MTKAERVVTALLARGGKEVASKSRKYRQFTRTDKPEFFYFVGKKGALRTGRVASASISLEQIVPSLLAKVQA